MEPSSLAEKNDIELLVLARAGDKPAFGELVERHMDAARRMASRMLDDEPAVQDIVQEAALQAYLSLDRLRKEVAFRSWFFGIVLNLCRSLIRDRQRRFFSWEAIEGGLRFEAIGFSGEQPDPQEIVEARELHRLILQAIDGLTEENRQATFLYYYQQLSVQEIGAILGMSAGAVKVRLHRSRKILSRRLMSLAGEERRLLPEYERRREMKKAQVLDVVKQEKFNGYIVVLQDEVGGRILPIWIGPFEGQSIAIGMQQIPMPRPLPFQFMANMLDALGVALEEVRIEAIRENTFYAVVKLSDGKEIKEVDARPSDALALAVLKGSPIFVDEEVLEAAGIDFDIPGGALEKPGTGMKEIVREIEEVMKGITKLPSEEERQASREGLLAYLRGGTS
jgi:RNA polymerase sigma factor (sigma-70 family)